MEVVKVLLRDEAFPLPINLGNHGLAVLNSNRGLAQMLHCMLERIAVDLVQPPGAEI